VAATASSRSSSPALPLSQETPSPHALLEGKARPETIALVEQAIADGAGKAIDAGWGLRSACRRNVASVSSPPSLRPPRHVGAVRAPPSALARTYGKDVQLQVELDPRAHRRPRHLLGDEVLRWQRHPPSRPRAPHHQR